MDTRREFLRKSMILSGAAGFRAAVPDSILKALAIDPAPGSTFLDAEHIVILMQENRSFDHCFGSLQGVRGLNDPRVITLPDQKPVWFQTNDKNETYGPFRLNIKESKVTWMGSLPHSRPSQVDAFNSGKYDKWLQSKKSGNAKYAQMPLTMGFYTREDLPFNYGMADAFTICDQNFCSAMTSTTPNRSFFWTGNIRDHDDGYPRDNIRNDNFAHAKMTWKTFPELLSENNISWKFYQNEISCGGGFKGEERSWLANFGCNLLEFFKAYNVKFTPYYIENLKKQVERLPGEINKLQEESPSSDEAAQRIKNALIKKQQALDNATAELKQWSAENFNKLTDEQKQLFYNAFVNNKGDKNYRSLSQLKYTDGGKERVVTVPAGDVFYQFRKDVDAGKLPTVSWFAGPQNFSDHPSAPWYGAWYVSEILDILTKNPEVWKKTIFIVTYDENDGYYDHVPPFSICDNNKPGTGKCSAGIDTEIEHVRLEYELKQGIAKKQAREAPVGLGFRVPMIIASPWSRGGKVCSQLFDHTSTLQFLETFVNQKYKKNIHFDNISAWRRTICGDLTAAFSPFDGKPVERVPFLKRDAFVETIFNAQFKQEPGNFNQLSAGDLQKVIENPAALAFMPQQEKGTRPSLSLPYELYADGKLSKDKKHFEVVLKAGNQFFGKKAQGSPFTAYAPVNYKEGDAAEVCRNWSFAVKAGDALQYEWPVRSFDNNSYHLRIHGPNGFYREFKGTADDPDFELGCAYETDNKGKPTGNLLLKLNSSAPVSIEIADNAYKNATLRKQVSGAQNVVLNLDKSGGWYDFSVKITGSNAFEKRYAGRVEKGTDSITDPFMGRVV
ncbi:phospholipase C, phosphocholine-specific [Niabella ginsenosidivorans]|uniref:phospholipase C n=1 Tax=Niabella ginsenosidivorans TaxID=1176587 RepID=A0A1A9I0Z6_9BACT|nr:phospholipase C, phosphocholine-specific [Niabella ginsenosidivorans]ANH81005.1 phospholipase C, phosphocholine-specific [Niabella ginsenosidivorans]